MKKKVLIIGNSANTYSTARKLSETCEVHVIPGSDTIKDFAVCADIRPSASSEILEYALENAIDLTIPIEEDSLKSNLVYLFEKNRLQIFGAPKQACEVLLDKALSKKFFYKLRIPTPKFGIFEKQSIALDYVKSQKIPFVVKTNLPCSAVVHTDKKTSQKQLDFIFAEKGQKAIIEDYIYGMPFGYYVITDGFKALPLGSSILYKYSLEGNGGQLTSGMGACIPNYKLSAYNEEFLMNSVIYPALDYFEKEGTPYCGILGINGIISEDGDISVLGWQTYLQDADCDGILETLDCNLYDLFESCAIGTFSDETDYIKTSDDCAVSIVLNCKSSDSTDNVIYGTNRVDDKTQISYFRNVKQNKYLEYCADKGQALVITAFGGTPRTSANRAYEAVSDIHFNGITYRKDICKDVE